MDSQLFLLPKKGKQKKPRRDLRAFQQLIIGLDGRCMNSRCEWHRRSTEALVAHHIIFRGHGGGDTEENGITLCRICHDLVHGIGTKDKTGDQEMSKMLERWLYSPEWRWANSYEWVRKRAPKQGGRV